MAQVETGKGYARVTAQFRRSRHEPVRSPSPSLPPPFLLLRKVARDTNGDRSGAQLIVSPEVREAYARIFQNLCSDIGSAFCR